MEEEIILKNKTNSKNTNTTKSNNNQVKNISNTKQIKNNQNSTNATKDINKNDNKHSIYNSLSKSIKQENNQFSSNINNEIKIKQSLNLTDNRISKGSIDLQTSQVEKKPKGKQQFFQEDDDIMGGDQAIYVSEKEWKKNIESPDWSNSLNFSNLLKKPKSQLKLDYVFGYRTRDTRNNLRYLTENKIVYHAGRYGIVHDLKNNTQNIISQHNEDIISLAVNNSKNLIATGENASKSTSEESPLICIWDEEANLIKKFEGNFHKGINSLNFSPESNFLLAVSLNEEHDIYLFDIKENRLMAASRGGTTKILDCVFKNEKEFATVGIKHFKYWMIKNGNLYAKDGFFGQCDNKLGLVVCHNGNFISGSATGEITIWRDELILLNKKCHMKNVDSLYCKDE